MLEHWFAGFREIWWVIGVPLAVGLILTTLRAIASQQPFDNDTSIDVALDMTFLALGASGGALIKPQVAQVMGYHYSDFIGAALIVMGFIAAFLLYHRRFSQNISSTLARVNLLLGVLACSLIAVVAYIGGAAEVSCS